VEFFGLFDEKNGEFLTVNFNAKSLKTGWNHLIVTFDNEKLFIYTIRIIYKQIIIIFNFFIKAPKSHFILMENQPNNQ